MKETSDVDWTSAVDRLSEIVPSTRYQGSKRRVLPWIYESLKSLRFDTVLDGFGGTASVSFLFKLMGKEVTYNDILLSNCQTGISLIENRGVKLNRDDVCFLTNENGFDYPTFIQYVFKDIYYLDTENKWLDTVIHNIAMLAEKYERGLLRMKQALAFHSLFQASLAKRPYSLFHRKNLYMRLAEVNRSFRNKTTWDTSFDDLFLRFSQEISRKVFSNNRINEVRHGSILDVDSNDFDLVYLDPPYFKSNRDRPIDYVGLYHFLEGMVDYGNWEKRIDYSRKHRPLIQETSAWDKSSVEHNLDRIFRKFQHSIIILSYGHPGYPSIETLMEILGQYKNSIRISRRKFTYRLNQSRRNNKESYELLLIAE